MSKPLSSFRSSNPPKTWAQWLEKPDTTATRGDIARYVGMYDAALRAQLPAMIRASRWYNRLWRWVKSRFHRAETPKPEIGE